MKNNNELIYPDQEWINDIVKLRNDLMNINSGFLETYLDDTFEEEESKDYQRQKMIKLAFFGTKILENYLYESEELKQDVYLSSLVYGDSGQGKIVLVDGSMGGGKTGFGAWTMDEYYKRNSNLRFFFVTKSETHPELPKWIKIVDDINKVKNNSIALIDEGAIQLSSRNAMSKQNKDASERLVQLRQKGITMIILVQNIKMVDTNVRRLANIRVLKFGIDFGSDENSNEDVIEIRRRLKPRSNREAYIEIPSRSIFLRFSHNLPEWWDDDKVSKYMRNWDKKEEVEKAIVNGKEKEIKSAEDLFE